MTGLPHPPSEARTDDDRRLAIKALLGREITQGLDLLDQLRRHPTVGGLVTNVIVRPAE